MSKKYITLILVAVMAVITLFFIVTGLFFSKTVNGFKHYMESRMLSGAEYVRRYIEAHVLTSDEYIDLSEIEEWLKKYIAGTGFERIVITDTTPTVLWSSHELIRQGESYEPYIIDEELFSSTVQREERRFSPIISIGTAYFQSLYYPFDYAGDTFVIVIDADQKFLLHASRIRTMMYYFAGLFFCITIVLVLGIYYIDKKREHEYARAGRHERLAFLGRISAELAHELKNPLAIIKTGIDAIRIKHDSLKHDQAFLTVSDEVMRVSSLIQNILNFSKNAPLPKEYFHPYAVVSDVSSHVTRLHPDIAVETGISQSLLLLGDATAFKQILDNLIRNAVHAMDGHGTIEIGEMHEGVRCMIFLRDSGPGIPKELTKKIFEPFVSGSHAGAGLGLAIVKSLCESLGWEIALLCAERGKTTFGITVKEKQWARS